MQRGLFCIVAGVALTSAALAARAAEPPPAEPPPEQSPAAAPPGDGEAPTADAARPPFEVTAPEGWAIIQTTEKRIVLARSDAPVPVPADQPMAVITRSSKVFTEETIRRQSTIQFGDDLKRWTFRGQPKIEKISVNGLPGYECIRKGTRTEGELRQRVYIGKLFLDDGNLVMMAYCADDEGAEANLAAFKSMMRTVKSRP